MNNLYLHKQIISVDTQKRLANIIQGILIEGQTDDLHAARNFLCRSFGTNSKVEKNFEKQSAIKKEQAEAIALFAAQENLWLQDLPDERTVF